MAQQTLHCVTFLTTFFILCSLHRATGLSCYHTDVINSTQIVTAECDAGVKSCLNTTTEDVLNGSRGTPNYTCGPEYTVPPGCHSNTINNTRITVCSCAVSLCNRIAQERPESEPDVRRTKERQAESEPDVRRTKERQARSQPDISQIKERKAKSEPDVRQIKKRNAKSEPDVTQTKTPQVGVKTDVRKTTGQVARGKPYVPRLDTLPAEIVSQCFEGRLILPKTRFYFGQAEYVALLTKQTEQVSCHAPKMCMRSVSEFQVDEDYHFIMGCEENTLPVAEKLGCHIRRFNSIRTQFCFCAGDRCNDNLAGLPADAEEWARNMATVIPWTHDTERKVFTEMQCYSFSSKVGENVPCLEKTCAKGVEMCERVKWKGVTEWRCADENATVTTGCHGIVVDEYLMTKCYCDSPMCNADKPEFVFKSDLMSCGDVLIMCWNLATVSLVFLKVLL